MKYNSPQNVTKSVIFRPRTENFNVIHCHLRENQFYDFYLIVEVIEVRETTN